jgi:propionyl-CoA synthetase
VSYESEFRRSIEDPEGFWRAQAEAIAWYKFPETILGEDENGNAVWFADGELNTAYLTLDVHVENGRGEQAALIYDSPVTGTVKTWTYRELRDEVALLAGGLTSLGVSKGDRVVIYMPMIPEAVIAMLACARLGAIHSVVFGGFAARELASRLDDAEPKLLITASCGIEFANIIPYKPLVDEAQRLSKHNIERCIVLQRSACDATLGAIDIDWMDLVRSASPADCVPVRGADPLYILYTSGTTGKPKGVVRDNGGHAVALRYSVSAVYGVAPGEVFWAASDVGWVVGHSYIVYAQLLAGCTTILFEGKPVRTPDAGTFWRVIADHKVNVFFTAPTAFRAIRKEDPEGKLLKQHDVSSLRTLFVAGERTDPATYHWLCDLLSIPVIDHWWQTETGWAIASNPVGIEPQASKAGSATFPMPGYDIRILNASQQETGPGEEGDVTVKLPLPPGCLPTVWGNHERFLASYLSQHPGYYQTGDGGYFDEDGYLFIMGRTDDVINVAGHRMSTGELEEIVAGHSAVAECAVIGIENRDKGQVPVGLVVLKDGANVDEALLQQELVAQVRSDVGAFANFKQIAVVERLPKTRSGKILRAAMRKLADGVNQEIPATIDDPKILEEVRARLLARGIGLISESQD